VIASVVRLSHSVVGLESSEVSRYSSRKKKKIQQSEEEKKNQPNLKISASISKNIHFIRHIRCPGAIHAGIKGAILVSLSTQTYRLIPSDIFSLLQCIAETCNRLIRPPPSCPWLRSLSHYLRVAYSFASVTSPENHTQGSRLIPCFTQQTPFLSPPSISLLSAHTLSVSLCFNI
jgi:hypothetical protein